MNKAHVLLALFILLGLSAEANADEGTLHAFTPADQKNHAVFMHQLSVDQINAVARIYPDFRILTLCKGRFSGTQRNEFRASTRYPIQFDTWYRILSSALFRLLRKK